jgi:hypothetical protein
MAGLLTGGYRSGASPSLISAAAAALWPRSPDQPATIHPLDRTARNDQSDGTEDPPATARLSPQSRPLLATVRCSPRRCPAVAILSRDTTLGDPPWQIWNGHCPGTAARWVADSPAGSGHDCRGRPAGR